MQSPWIIAAYSLFFMLLALALFNSYSFHLPASWHMALVKTSQANATGHYWGAALMGGLSTLILSPCATAPLIGALGYISRSGNIGLGSAALFTLGFGMGFPLLIIGTSLGKWLPRAGIWMHRINQFFALLLLVVAITLISRIIPSRLNTEPYTVTTLPQALAALNKAVDSNQPVFVDFYADWCESCQIIEARLHHSKAIQNALVHVVLIKVDITRNDADSRALSAYFDVVAPPTLIFYPNPDQIDTQVRLVGNVSASDILNALQSVHK